MIEVAGEVIALDGGLALVKMSSRAGGCGRCNEPGGCGGTKVGSMFRPETAEFWLANDIDAEVGEAVRICLPEEVSVRAALLCYLVPVLGIVVGAALGVLLGGAQASDLHAVAGAFAGLAAGILVSRGLGRRGGDSPAPVLRRAAGGQT